MNIKTQSGGTEAELVGNRADGLHDLRDCFQVKAYNVNQLEYDTLLERFL